MRFAASASARGLPARQRGEGVLEEGADGLLERWRDGDREVIGERRVAVDEQRRARRTDERDLSPLSRRSSRPVAEWVA
jgi:hypothetical protein